VYNLVSNKYLFFLFAKHWCRILAVLWVHRSGIHTVAARQNLLSFIVLQRPQAHSSPVDDYTSAFHPGFHPPDCERTMQFAAKDREPKHGLDPVVGDSVQGDDVECDKKLPARPVALDGKMVKSDGRKVCADSKRMFEAKRRLWGRLLGVPLLIL
jgi:hypothetical protein